MPLVGNGVKYMKKIGLICCCIVMGLCLFALSACTEKDTETVASDQAIYVGDGLQTVREKFSQTPAGAEFFFVEYADEDRIIFQTAGYLLVILNTDNNWKIESIFDLKALNLGNTQGAVHTAVSVVDKGKLVNLQNFSLDGSPSPLYCYNTVDHTLSKKENVVIQGSEKNGVFVLRDGDIFETYDGMRLKSFVQNGVAKVALLNPDNTIDKEIELMSMSSDVGYVGNETIVQIEFPVGQDGGEGFTGKSRLVCYNLSDGSISEKQLVELF